MSDAAIEACGDDYNVYVPINNALGALGKEDALRNVRLRRIQALENHLKQVPDDARARSHLAGDYAGSGQGPGGSSTTNPSGGGSSGSSVSEIDSCRSFFQIIGNGSPQ